MPSRSHVSLASGTGSSTKNNISVEKLQPPIALSPLARAMQTNLGNYESGLPPPVQHPHSLSSGRRGKKKTRIDDNARGNLRVHWAKFLRKIGTGTAPSSSSNFEGSTGESSGYNRHSRVTAEDVDEPLDEVVVDREWGDELKATSATHSEHAISPEKSGGSNQLGGPSTDRESLVIRAEGFWASWTPLIYLRWRVWPVVFGFFWTRFLDQKSEDQYSKENWFLRKRLAIWSSLFFILNWILATIVIPRPAILPDIIFYYCLAPIITFPLTIMITFDFPRDRALLYQLILVVSTWSWGIYQLVSMRLCNFYDGMHGLYPCDGKDFLSTFYYTSALQTIALFGLKMHRFPAMMGMVAFIVCAGVLIVPDRKQFVRYIVNFIVFQGFLLYVHYMRENAERRLYNLRDQLKIQFRATQKAQVNERKASDSKRRLTSYVFHEVRVPLNTALLAVQNMEASGTVAKAQEIEFKALEGSLSMMSKVLNDVLDFNRMDSGRFESVLKPYAFHKVMRSLFVPLQMATDARDLKFVTDLDKDIDDVARRALYQAMGLTENEVAKRMAIASDRDGIVVGDETRLRQIITNLASNACKFTSAGGQLIIKTRLVLPNRHGQADTGRDSLDDTPLMDPGTSPVSTPGKDDEELHLQLSASHLTRHNVMTSKPPPPVEWIVVRIEVTDTGCGIKRRDMVQSKLFSAFNQTEMGRQQGGKGTGLGLALVRQIVKLSGGRLGVQSKSSEGSTFWVELPLGVGTKAIPGLRSMESPDVSQDLVDRSLNGILGSPVELSSADIERHEAQMAHSAQQTRTNSAMHTIMEQGGLVEIPANRNDDSPVLTRTIGDPLTGTDPITPGVPDDASPTQFLQELPRAQNFEFSSRPQYVQLPAPQEFSADQIHMGLTPPASASSTLGRTSGAISPQGSPQWEPGIRVLIVDDDPLTRKLMSRMLSRIGCKVSSAENGEIALEMILGMGTRVTPSSEETGSAGLSVMEGSSGLAGALYSGEEYKYAVVFLDNQMPVMSGLELVAKLRELGRHDFVVGVTGNALLADQQEYLEAGVDHVLTKPVYEKSLRSMLVIAEERRKRGTPILELPDPSSGSRS